MPCVQLHRFGVRSPALGASLLFLMLLASGGLAQPVDEIIVVADPLKLIELQSSRTAYGLDLSYSEAPRSVSVISDATIARFNIETIDDLAAVAPGTFTGSFFGVPGSVNLRGSRADSYFRGFKRVENPGTFPTPIGASERIEVVRGPTPPMYGAGRVGGFVNVTPLTALTRKEIGERGRLLEVGATLGSYEKRIIDAAAGAAFSLGGDAAGVYLYTEYENSGSYYRGVSPERALVQAAFTLSGAGYELELGGAYYSSDGYNQTIGWNRVTQDLIDNGTYVTGRDTDLRDLNGDGKLTPDEVDQTVGSFFGASNIRQFVDFGVFPGAAFALDEDVGTVTLDPRTVFVSDRDIADAETATAYADLALPLGGSTVRLQAFYDSLTADLFVSYGFAAQYIADVYELRATYELPATIGPFTFSNLVGGSFRRYGSQTRQTFLSGYLAADRRDLAAGPTGGDVFDDPFSAEVNGIGWDTDLRSDTSDLAVFLLSDVAATERLSFLAGVRLDRFRATSINTGATIFDPRLGFTDSSGSDFAASYEVSARFAAARGANLYATYASNHTFETNDAGGVEVERIDQENFVADSSLIEAGVKIGTRSATGSIALFHQERQRQDPFGNLDEETSKGLEAELKYLVSDAWSLTSALTFQETRVGAPGSCGSGNGEFVVIPPTRAGLAPHEGYGGLFAALNASCLSELQDGYKRNTTPDMLASAFLTYTSPRLAIGTLGATVGATYVGKTGGKIADAIVLPGYALAKASVIWQARRFSLAAHIDNLFDERHFIPVQNVYEEVGVLPGRGREVSISLRARF